MKLFSKRLNRQNKKILSILQLNLHLIKIYGCLSSEMILMIQEELRNN